MQIKPKKGLGLLGKLILFSLLPAYLIVGMILYFYNKDLKQGITQKYIEESLSAATAIQKAIGFTDLIQRPWLVTAFLDEMIQINPNFLKITIYAKVDGKVKIVVSTDPEKIGQDADPEDAEPILTGESVTAERLEEGLNLQETISPYLENGKPVASIGIYTSLKQRNILVANLTKQIFWFVLPGCALMLIAIFLVVHRVLLVPIQEIAKGSDALARGKLGYRLPVRGQDEIGRLTESFNIMASSLEDLVKQLDQKSTVIEQKNKELETFVYTVSHDLKSPVVALQGMAGILLEDYKDKLDEQGRHYLARLTANANQMEQLIQDLLELSRIGRINHPPEKLDLNQTVKEIIDRCYIRFPNTKVEVSLAPLPTLLADRVRTQQVFENLLTNAFKFMGHQPHPRVEVGVKNDEAAYTFWVKDNGIGIDPAYQEKIFGIFQRLQEVEVEGSGVGLTIVKRIVEGVGGKVWVQSEKGKGATFHFTWPKHQDGGADVPA